MLTLDLAERERTLRGMPEEPALFIELEVVFLVAGAQVEGLSDQHLLQLILFDLSACGLDRESSCTQQRVLHGSWVEALGRFATRVIGRGRWTRIRPRLTRRGL